MAKKVTKLNPVQKWKLKPSKPSASGKMPAEAELVAAVKMLDCEPAIAHTTAKPPYRRSLVD